MPINPSAENPGMKLSAPQLNSIIRLLAATSTEFSQNKPLTIFQASALEQMVRTLPRMLPNLASIDIAALMTVENILKTFFKTASTPITTNVNGEPS